VQGYEPARRHRIPLRFRDRLEKRPLRMRIIRLSGMVAGAYNPVDSFIASDL